ncbi:MAG: hypothetical protein RR588_02085 [Solibacillus sp.]
MYIKNEYIQLDEDYGLVQSTVQIMENVRFIFFEETQDATLDVNGHEIHIRYSKELADILVKLRDHTAENLLITLVQHTDGYLS